jgi:hypothetical protein
MPGMKEQLLHFVFGGELKAAEVVTFKDLSKLDLVGMYPNFAEAKAAWRRKAQATVDNAQMRYFVVHVHRLIDPGVDHEDLLREVSQTHALSRTPRPPLGVPEPSDNSTIPNASNAAVTFMRESTLPRMTPSLASIRWIVGTDSPDLAASCL